MAESKKSIDNYVKGEMIVRFEKNVSKTFAQEFIRLLGYEVLDDSRYESERLRGHMLIKVPKEQESEIMDTLDGYKKIVKYCEPNGTVKGAGKDQSIQQKMR